MKAILSAAAIAALIATAPASAEFWGDDSNSNFYNDGYGYGYGYPYYGGYGPYGYGAPYGGYGMPYGGGYGYPYGGYGAPYGAYPYAAPVAPQAPAAESK